MSGLIIPGRKKFLLDALEDKRHLLRVAVDGMLVGDLRQSLNVATIIRALVHEGGRSVPLLKRLRTDYLALHILQLPSPPEEQYSRFSSPHTLMHLPFSFSVSSGDPKVRLSDPPDKSGYRATSLGGWWRKAVLKVPGCNALTRKEIVLGLANKEGAHVDDNMSENYRKILGSKPLLFTQNGVEVAAANVIRFACGQAGLEMLAFLDAQFPPSPVESDEVG